MATLVAQPAAPMEGQEGGGNNNVFLACREAKAKLLILRGLLMRLDAAHAPSAGKGVSAHSRHMAAADTLLLIAHTDTLVKPTVRLFGDWGVHVGVAPPCAMYSHHESIPTQTINYITHHTYKK